VDPTRSPFENNDIVLPIVVLRELDGLKSDPRRGGNARRVIRLLDTVFSDKDAMLRGVKNLSGGVMRVVGADGGEFSLPKEYSGNTADDLILRVAGESSVRGNNTILVTMDGALRLKARAAGLEAQELHAGKVERPQTLAPHIVEVPAPSHVIDQLYQEGSISVEDVSLPYGMQYNACCRVLDKNHKCALGIYTAQERIVVVRKSDNCRRGTVVPRNAEQLFAYALATKKEVLATILVGVAGTGKTLMALKAGVDLLEDPESSIPRILCFRPTIELGSPLGFLPGSAEEKFAPWASAVQANLLLLFSRRNNSRREEESKKRPKQSADPRERLGKYMKEGIISIEPVTFIRGTTFPNSFIVVDEAQNLTPHEVKALLTRAGEGSRVVLTGDLTQIDTPHLDAGSCGLAKALERMRGEEFGAIELVKGERSPLATLIAELFADL